MAFCRNCGKNLNEGDMFCDACGANQATGEAPISVGPRVSSWDGGVLETFVTSLLASLLIIVTLGIATPFAMCYMINFLVARTTIDGKRLRFDGSGLDLFGHWIIWMVLTLITCGIYSFWVVPKMYQWVVKNIHVA